MSDSSRSVMALASLGVGLVHLAVGAGSPLFAAILLVGFGAAELAWGIVVLSTGRIVLPRAALPLSLTPIALWGLDVTAGVAIGSNLSALLPFGPMAAAALLNLVVGVGLAVARRRRPPARPAASASGTWRYLLGMTAGALLVAGIVTPALAGTRAGSAAVPHGEHQTTSVPGETPSPADPAPLHHGH